MRHVLGSTTARLAEWTIAPLPYLSVLRGRMLARLTNSALVNADQNVYWSSVVKMIGAREAPSATAAAGSGQREVQAYRSSLLSDLPGHLRASSKLSVISVSIAAGASTAVFRACRSLPRRWAHGEGGGPRPRMHDVRPSPADDRSADVAPGAAPHTLRAFRGLLRTNVLVRVTAAAVMTRLSRWRPGPMT